MLNKFLKLPYYKIYILIFFLLIGTALYSPFINYDYTYDDFLFISLMEENIPVNPWLGFWAVDIQDTKIFESMWWADKDAEGTFFRPIPTIIVQTVYKLWGRNSALPLHLFSIILHCINAFLVFITLNKISNRQVISLAAGFIYLICVHHVINVGWIATNTDLLAVFFMLISIYCYVSLTPQPPLHIERGSKKDSQTSLNTLKRYKKFWLIFFSLLMQLLAFGCKETASITTAAIILYELIIVPENDYVKTFFSRWKYWVWSTAITICFLVFYKLGGFGINSLLYYDPFLHPVLFVKNLLIGYPLMFLGLLSVAPFSFPVFVPELLLPFVISGTALTILFIIVLIPYRKDKMIIYCFFLFIISILPQLSADATERQLYFPFVLGSFIISFLIFQIPLLKKKFSPDTPAAAIVIGKPFSYYLLISSVVLSFILMLTYPSFYSSSAPRPQQYTLKVKELADNKHASKIFMLNIPGSINLLYMNDIYRYYAGRYADFNILYGGNGKLWLIKTGSNTISLKTDTKGWLTNMFAKLPRTNPLIEKNREYSKKDFTVQIVETTLDNEDILEAEFKFKSPLTSPDCIVIYFDGNDLKELNINEIKPGEWILIGDTSDVLKFLM
ncbi:MAG TPA: hypothetical protein VJ455_12370 [Ignavibacteria bacterium]|nr:hypothetical protein [Ignavibacteria bacterium]